MWKEALVYSLVVYSGDQSAHSYNLFDVKGLPEDNVLWSVFNSTQLIASSFTGIPVFPTFGNNDFPSNYMPPTLDPEFWYGIFFTVWEPLIRCTLCKEDKKPILQPNFEELFLQGGYYRVDVSGEIYF